MASTPRRRAVSGPKDDPHLARLKLVLRGVQDRKELRERAMKFKKPLTSQQLVALLHVYPGSCTWQAKFLFEHFAPKLSDKQKTYKKLVQKLKPMIYRYDLDEPYEAWVVRILDVDTSQSSVDVTPVPKVKPVKPVPPPEEEVPPSPLAVAPAAANPGDDASALALAQYAGQRDRRRASLMAAPAARPVEAPVAAAPEPAPNPIVEGDDASALALAQYVRRKRRDLFEGVVSADPIPALVEAEPTAPALAPAEPVAEPLAAPTPAEPSNAPTASEPAAEPVPPLLEPVTEPPASHTSDRVPQAPTREAVAEVVAEPKGQVTSDVQTSTGVVSVHVHGVEESKDDPLQCENCYEQIDACAAKSFLCCPEVVFCGDCTVEFVENSSCGKCFLAGISDTYIIGYGQNLEPFALIQRALRGMLGRKLAKRVRLEAVAAIHLERVWRGSRARRVKREAAAAIHLERVWRGARARRVKREAVAAALHLERVWRGARARRGGVEQLRASVAPATPISKASPSAKLLSPIALTPNEPVERACPTLVALGTPDSPLLETSPQASPKKKNSPEGPPEPDFEAGLQEKHLCEVREGTTLKITGEGPMALVLGPERPADPTVMALQSGTLRPVPGGGVGTPRSRRLARLSAGFSEDGCSPNAEVFSSPEPVTSPQAPLNDTNRVDQTPPREPPKRSWSPFRCAQK